MKRILSIMLTVMLILSSFVMVSAEEPYFEQVIIVDEIDGASHLFGTTFDGFHAITVKVFVPEGVKTATMSVINAGETVASIDLPTFTNGKWVDASLNVDSAFDSVEFTVESGKFYVSYISVDILKARSLVYEDDFELGKVNDVALGGDVNFFTRSSKPNTDKGAMDLTSALTDTPYTSFTVQNGVDENKTRVAKLDYPYYVSNDARRTDEEGNPVSDRQKASTESVTIKKSATSTVNVDTNLTNSYIGREYYNLKLGQLKNADHVMLEVDVYNAATSWDNDTTDEQIAAMSESYIKDKLYISFARETVRHNQGLEVPFVYVSGLNVGLRGKSDTDLEYSTGSAVANTYSGYADKAEAHNAQPKTWNKLVYEIKKVPYKYVTASGVEATRYHAITKATYNGVTITNDVYKSYADDLSSLTINVDCEYGGTFYLDNLKVYEISDVDKAYVTRYEENFDGETNTVSEYRQGQYNAGSYVAGEFNSTFTVEEGDTNPTKFGRIYNKYYNYSSGDYTVKRYLDDGSVDEAADYKAIGEDCGREFFVYKIPGLDSGWGGVTENDTRYMRVSFKYYLPDSAYQVKNSDGTKVKQNGLIVGLTPYKDATSGLHAYGLELYRVLPLRENSMTVSQNPGSTNSDATKTFTTNFDSKLTGKWVPVVIEIKSTGIGAKGKFSSYWRYNSEFITSVPNSIGVTTHTNNDGYDMNNIIFGVDHNYGGIAYIDDIKVETNILSDADYENIETVAVDNVYLKKTITQIPAGEFRIEKYGTFSNDEQKISISKGYSDIRKVQFVLALYNGDVLEDASVNELDVENINPFTTKSFNLTELVDVPTELTGYIYKAFLFSADEGLKPLADMIKSEAKDSVTE